MEPDTGPAARMEDTVSVTAGPASLGSAKEKAPWLAAGLAAAGAMLAAEAGRGADRMHEGE